jgi:NAD(P)-dependent dehydrogenase (short-subunit alcohol dehydrogenase family)
MLPTTKRRRNSNRKTGVKVDKWGVTDFDQCSKGMEKICADFGGNIEILVNNARITRNGMHFHFETVFL